MPKPTPANLMRLQSQSSLFPFTYEPRSRESFKLAYSTMLPPESSRSSTSRVGRSSSTKMAQRPSSSSMHALKFRVQPPWRNDLSDAQTQTQTPQHTSDSSGSVRASQSKQLWQQFKQRPSNGHRRHSSTTSAAASVPPERTSSTSVRRNLSRPQQKLHALQYSIPLFEVLPSLAANSRANLLYENSILLEGIKYDYDMGAPYDSNRRLTFDYDKFTRSISTKAKLSDRDVIFGNARVLFSDMLGWERSRIEWLVELERQKRRFRRRSASNYKEPADAVAAGSTECIAAANSWEDDEDKELMVHICCLPFNTAMLSWHIKP